MLEKVKVGLALGAGGARGLAHIGVLKELEKAGIKISFICGSSIGALVGGLYAHNRSAAALEKLALDFPGAEIYKKLGLPGLREVFHESPESVTKRLLTSLKRTYIQSLMVTRLAILNDDTVSEAIEYGVPEVDIQDLSLPFGAVANDLLSGRPVLFRTGSLRRAVLASMAIPGVVTPVRMDDLLLVDGGVLNSIPVQPLLDMGADVILAVDVEMVSEIKVTDEYKRGVEILFRAEDMESYVLKETQLLDADLVLRPKAGHIHWSDFGRAAEIIRLGQDETVLHMDRIVNLAQKRKLFPGRKNNRVNLAFDWVIV